MHPVAVPDPLTLLRPRRKITGASAVLLPFSDAGTIDWDTFVDLVARTADEGLVPAVNMDTGYVNLIAPADRLAVLARTQEVMAGRRFFAGAFVADQPGAACAVDQYLAAVDAISTAGGTPVVFQSFGLTEQGPDALIASYERIGQAVDAFVAFELGTMFAPFGAIYDLDTYDALLRVRSCIGAKHSSLDRGQEWQRIVLRDRVRPDFHVFTGNDLAIDMVMYGSDYLLGLSAFAPDVFARRDAMWETGDPSFHALNDDLQYLGQLAFRAPVPAYKHSAAMFLAACKRIPSDAPHPQGARRPESDRPLLEDIAARLGLLGAGW